LTETQTHTHTHTHANANTTQLGLMAGYFFYISMTQLCELASTFPLSSLYPLLSLSTPFSLSLPLSLSLSLSLSYSWPSLLMFPSPLNETHTVSWTVISPEFSIYREVRGQRDHNHVHY